jgi:hypothetical protein
VSTVQQLYDSDNLNTMRRLAKSLGIKEVNNMARAVLRGAIYNAAKFPKKAYQSI